MKKINTNTNIPLNLKTCYNYNSKRIMKTISNTTMCSICNCSRSLLTPSQKLFCQSNNLLLKSQNTKAFYTTFNLKNMSNNDKKLLIKFYQTTSLLFISGCSTYIVSKKDDNNTLVKLKDLEINQKFNNDQSALNWARFNEEKESNQLAAEERCKKNKGSFVKIPFTNKQVYIEDIEKREMLIIGLKPILMGILIGTLVGKIWIYLKHNCEFIINIIN